MKEVAAHEDVYRRPIQVDKAKTVPVINPFDGSQIDTVPRGDGADVEAAISSAVRGAAVMANLTGYQRFAILRKAADLIEERREDLARTITMEEGKTIAEARTEGSSVCPDHRALR